jgi:hypothetical protein
MTKLNIDYILSQVPAGPSRWELDNIVYNDRTTSPETLTVFLNRIQVLRNESNPTESMVSELAILEELAEELDQDECVELLGNDDIIARQLFIENLARRGAIEVLCKDRVSEETMNMTCKLSPSDFVLTAKRTQDLINSIRELVIQGETLSKDVAGA